MPRVYGDDEAKCTGVVWKFELHFYTFGLEGGLTGLPGGANRPSPTPLVPGKPKLAALA